MLKALFRDEKLDQLKDGSEDFKLTSFFEALSSKRKRVLSSGITAMKQHHMDHLRPTIVTRMVIESGSQHHFLRQRKDLCRIGRLIQA